MDSGLVTRGDQLAGAVFDASGQYRYQLWRRSSPPWLLMNQRHQRTILWVMLNPSTADERQLDPTLRRCRAYSDRWGFTAWEVCNLFAFRATKPAVMKAADHPVGPDNDKMILDAAERAEDIVVAWGVHGIMFGRDQHVTGLLRSTGKPLWCLKTVSVFEQPAHPLYLPANTMMKPYRSTSAASVREARSEA